MYWPLGFKSLIRLCFIKKELWISTRKNDKHECRKFGTLTSFSSALKYFLQFSKDSNLGTLLENSDRCRAQMQRTISQPSAVYTCKLLE